MKTSINRILFITGWQFEDALVQTYTLPYVAIIRRITSCYPFVVTVNNSQDKVKVRKKSGVVSIELPSAKRLLFFGWVINILILRTIIKKKKIRILHPWCTPAGGIGALLKRMDKSLTLNIDSFEPHAESMVENKTWSRFGLKYKVLFYLEKIGARIADYLILAAPGMEKYILEKYKTTIANYSVKPACVDLNAFSDKFSKNKEFLDRYGLTDKVVCLYVGKFGGIYMEDETFEFIKNCQDFWGKDKFRFLLLSNAPDDYLNEKIAKHHIDSSTTIKLFVDHKEIPLYIGLADFAISPYKPVPSKRYCAPIKNGEYWAMGLPVVITPHISIDSAIIEQHNAGAILTSLDEKGYKKAIAEIDVLIKGKSRTEIYNQIRPLAEKYRNFTIAEDVYHKIYG